MSDKCKFSTYGYACGKPVEHGRYLCEEHASSKCSSCGQPATHGCDFCGQFVCGAPLCDECTFGTDSSKSGGAWGFMNHIHVSKPEFSEKHENARLQTAITAKDAEIVRLREALTAARASIRNARGAVESNQVVDKDVHGTLTRALEQLDAALSKQESTNG